MSSRSTNPPDARSHPASDHNGNACSIISALSDPAMFQEFPLTFEDALPGSIMISPKIQR
jgi:hypothetical protein